MIESIKDLEKLLKLCRKQGVTKITLPQVSFELGDLPHQSHRGFEEIQDAGEAIPGMPTDEELMFLSSDPRQEAFREPEQ